VNSSGNSQMRRWRGLARLVREGVEHGSAAVERVQRATAERTFVILEAIPGVAEPAKVVHVVHDASLSVVHASIRAVTRVVGAGLDAALAIAEGYEDQSTPVDRARESSPRNGA
jgi:hypothetical protein